jgi:hypothetical protein
MPDMPYGVQWCKMAAYFGIPGKRPSGNESKIQTETLPVGANRNWVLVPFEIHRHYAQMLDELKCNYVEA